MGCTCYLSTIRLTAQTLDSIRQITPGLILVWEHGAVAGVILFFTCLSAVLGPLAMGAVSDSFGDPQYGFILATGFAGVLFIGLLLNWILNPTRSLLQKLDVSEYQVIRPQDVPLQPQL